MKNIIYILVFMVGALAHGADYELQDPATILTADLTNAGTWCSSGYAVGATCNAGNFATLSGANSRIVKQSYSLGSGHYTLTITALGKTWVRVMEPYSTSSWTVKFLDDQHDNGDTGKTYSLDFDIPSGVTAVDIVVQSYESGSPLPDVVISALSISDSTSFTFVEKETVSSSTYKANHNWTDVTGNTTSLTANYAYLEMGGSTGDGISRNDVVLLAQKYMLTATGKNVTVEINGVSLNVGSELYKIVDVTSGSHTLAIKITNSANGNGFIKGVSLKPVLDFNINDDDTDDYSGDGWSKTSGATVSYPGSGGSYQITASDWDSKIYSSIILPPDDYVITVVARGKSTLMVMQDWSTTLLSSVISDDDGTGAWTTKHVFYESSSSSAVKIVIKVGNNTDDLEIKELRIERAPLHDYAPPTNLRGWTYGNTSITKDTYPLGSDSTPDYQDDLDDLATMGANFVRLAINYPADTTTLNNLVTMISYACDTAGLKVSLVGPHVDKNSGIANSNLWEDTNLESHFISLWEAVADRIDYERTNTSSIFDGDCVISYDLSNEPDYQVNDPSANAADRVPPMWRDMAQAIANAIRAYDDKTWITYEPGAGGLGNGFDYLKPLADHKVIYSRHVYITHQYALQNQENSEDGFREDASAGVKITYPDSSYIEEADLDSGLHDMDLFEAKYQVPAYVGEFNAVKWAEGADTWLVDIIKQLEARNWIWTAHGWREWQGWNVEFNTKYFRSGQANGAHYIPSSTFKTSRYCAIATGLSKNGTVWTDSDSDGYGNTCDAFSNSVAAAEDYDSDGKPDHWNSDCDATCQTGSTLTLDNDDDGDSVNDTSDSFPLNNGASADTDDDGKPDDWGGSCSGTSCQGMILDTNDDNDEFTDTEEASLGTDRLNRLDPPHTNLTVSALIGLDDVDYTSSTYARYGLWGSLGFDGAGDIDKSIETFTAPNGTYGCQLITGVVDCGNGTLSNVVKLQSAFDSSCALQTNGAIQCWYRADINGTQATNITSYLTSLDSIVDFAVHKGTDTRGCAVEGDSSDYHCWDMSDTSSSPYYQAVSDPFTYTLGSPTLGDFDAVAVGANHICLLEDTGYVHCRATSGTYSAQLGDSDSDGYVDISGTEITNARKIVAGDDFTCALRGAYETGNGTVYCWGSGAPSVSGLSKPVDITALGSHVCVMDAGVTNQENMANSILCFDSSGGISLNDDADDDGVCDGDTAVSGICVAGPDVDPLNVDTDGDGYCDGAGSGCTGLTGTNDAYPLDPNQH